MATELSTRRPVVESKRGTALFELKAAPVTLPAAAQPSAPDPSVLCRKVPGAPLSPGSVSVCEFVAAAAASVTAPVLEPLSANDLAPVTAAPSLTVTPLLFRSLPLLLSKSARPPAVALVGTVNVAAAHGDRGPAQDTRTRVLQVAVRGARRVGQRQRVRRGHGRRHELHRATVVRLERQRRRAGDRAVVGHRHARCAQLLSARAAGARQCAVDAASRT
jgi:hypothetical protein